MNLVDKVVNWLSPEAGLNRAVAREQLSIYRSKIEAAGHGKRFENWITMTTSPKTGNSHEIHTLRNRVRHLVQNNPYASRALNALVSYLVNEGIQPHAYNGNRKSEIDELLKLWADKPYCDTSQRKNLYGIQALAVRAMIRDGEVLIRRIYNTSDDLPIPLQLEIIEADHIDSSKHKQLDNGNEIVQGVEFDQDGKRVAYWLFEDHPADRGFTKNLQSKRFEAEDFIHLFREDRPGQVRGVSWFAPAVIRLKDFDEYEDAQLMRQKISSLFVGIYKNLNPRDDKGARKQFESGELQPGTFMMAPFGYDMEWSNPPQTHGFGEYANHTKYTLSIACEVPYMILSGDYSKCNFSSARMAMLNFYKFIEPTQSLLLVPQMCFPIELWFFDAAALKGIEADATIKWQCPVRDHVDPEKESRADETKLRNGLVTHPELIRSKGIDPYDHYEEIAEYQKYFKKKGLDFLLSSSPEKEVTDDTK